MKNELKNNTLSISVDNHGAELTSIRKGEREYLWQADPEFWKRHSPVLFPIVGSVWNGEFRSHGKTWKMSQHGFARDTDFELLRKTEDSLVYQIESNAETLERYPYPFRLTISYRLHENVIDVTWKVENTGREEMSFMIGAHPAFYWPMREDGNRGYFKFQGSNGLYGSNSSKVSGCLKEVVSSVIEKKGCISNTKVNHVALEDGYLHLTKDTFTEIDTIVLENHQVSAVSLCDENKVPYLTLKFGHPLVGLWSPPGKNAPFVCIEPWYGRADFVDYTGTFEERKWMNHLAVGKTFEATYQIEVN